VAEPERTYTQEDVDKLIALQRRTLRRVADLETRMHELEENFDDLHERMGVLRSADRYVTRDEMRALIREEAKPLINQLISTKVNNMIQKAAKRR
jgi:hypothetical protein